MPSKTEAGDALRASSSPSRGRRAYHHSSWPCLFLRKTHKSCFGRDRAQLDVPVFCERLCKCEPFGELCSDRGLGRSEALRFSEYLFDERRSDDNRTIV